jgi:hypothetical protein
MEIPIIKTEVSAVLPIKRLLVIDTPEDHIQKKQKSEEYPQTLDLLIDKLEYMELIFLRRRVGPSRESGHATFMKNKQRLFLNRFDLAAGYCFYHEETAKYAQEHGILELNVGSFYNKDIPPGISDESRKCILKENKKCTHWIIKAIVRIATSLNYKVEVKTYDNYPEDYIVIYNLDKSKFTDDFEDDVSDEESYVSEEEEFLDEYLDDLDSDDDIGGGDDDIGPS